MSDTIEEQPPTIVPVAVVVPAYNAAATLRACLAGLQRTTMPAEVVVVDAGSTDDTADIAAELGATVVPLAERAGPAAARNAGVKHVGASIVLFIDADCVSHADVVERVHESFMATRDLVSLTGSYDDDPPARGFFSQYMNLRHHWVHQNANTENATFWAGCGAVRREVFEKVGGFDDSRYPRPMIEDIELGFRLRQHGRTRLDPRLLVTHLKQWTLRSVVKTDVVDRGFPWSLLLLESGGLPNDLNLRTPQRIAGILAPFVLGGIIGLPLAVARGAWPLIAIFAICVVASVVLQRGMLGFFARRRGWPFAIGAWLFHQVHLLYGAACLAVAFLYRFARSRRCSS